MEGFRGEVIDPMTIGVHHKIVLPDPSGVSPKSQVHQEDLVDPSNHLVALAIRSILTDTRMMMTDGMKVLPLMIEEEGEEEEGDGATHREEEEVVEVEEEEDDGPS